VLRSRARRSRFFAAPAIIVGTTADRDDLIQGQQHLASKPTCTIRLPVQRDAGGGLAVFATHLDLPSRSSYFSCVTGE